MGENFVCLEGWIIDLYEGKRFDLLEGMGGFIHAEVEVLVRVEQRFSFVLETCLEITKGAAHEHIV